MEQVQQEKGISEVVAMERPYKPLDRQMFVTGVVVAILVGVIMLLAGEFMAILVLAAVIFAYYVWSTVLPQQVEHRITTRGIRTSGQLYSWGRWPGGGWRKNGGSKLLVVETPVSWPKQLHLVLGAEEAVVRGVMEKILVDGKTNGDGNG